MKTKKKSPKAVTLLTKIEGLLSDVIDECSAIEKSVEKNVRELLLSAKGSIESARDFVVGGAPAVKPKAAAKTKAKAKAPAKAKKRAPAPAAKKRTAKAV